MAERAKFNAVTLPQPPARKPELGSAAAPSTSGAAARRRRGRIVLVSHTAEPSGAELSLIDIAGHLGDEALVCLFQHGPIVETLERRGVAVEVLEGRRSMLRVRSGAGLLAVAAAVPGVLALARRLSRLVGPDDVLYANSQKAWIVAALVAWRRGRPVVWHLRDIVSAAHFGVAQRTVAIALANRVAACVVVNSAATGDAFFAMGGRRDLLRVVHNGIDEAPFLRLRQGRNGTLRRDLALEYPVIVGLFGRLAHWKGQHILLEALRRLDGVAALIVGDALFGERDYVMQLRALAAEPALAGRVRLLGHRNDVPELMNALDIVVHASIEPEPFGRVIVEGMLAERPVIATNGGGVTEIITDGVDGVLVPPNDADALAAAIRSLAADPARARRLAAAGYEKARRRFVLDVMQLKLAVVLEELMPAQHTRSAGQPCA